MCKCKRSSSSKVPLWLWHIQLLVAPLPRVPAVLWKHSSQKQIFLCCKCVCLVCGWEFRNSHRYLQKLETVKSLCRTLQLFTLGLTFSLAQCAWQHWQGIIGNKWPLSSGIHFSMIFTPELFSMWARRISLANDPNEPVLPLLTTHSPTPSTILHCSS